MKKILYILFFIFVSVSLDNITFAESKIDKVKNKIKAAESKVVNKIWGTKDCSQYSTKTLAGLAKYKRFVWVECFCLFPAFLLCWF